MPSIKRVGTTPRKNKNPQEGALMPSRKDAKGHREKGKTIQFLKNLIKTQKKNKKNNNRPTRGRPPGTPKKGKYRAQCTKLCHSGKLPGKRSHKCTTAKAQKALLTQYITPKMSALIAKIGAKKATILTRTAAAMSNRLYKTSQKALIQECEHILEEETGAV